MSPTTEAETAEPRSQTAKAHSEPAVSDLTAVIAQTTRLWRQHHLDYDQTKYVVEQVRRALALSPPRNRQRTVDRLDRGEIERLIAAAYRRQSQYGLIVKTLFYTGARVAEFIQIRVEDLHLDDDPPQIRIRHAKRQSTRFVPILPGLAQDIRTHLNGRRSGSLFESNRHTRYSPRTIQDIIKETAQAAGITKRVYPHLLRHSIATLLLQSGEVPLDQVQKFLGHLQIGTTQIYAETSLRALGENYQRAFASLSLRLG
jgi:integrase/recombinase XerD